jgi:hypothetical protein
VDALTAAAIHTDADTAEAAERALFRIGTAAWGRCSALICLREIGSRSALSQILESLGDPSNNVRLEAVRALVKFPGEAVIPPLMKLVAAENDPYIRAEAIGVIRMNGTPHPGLAGLGQARLADPDWNVRAQAAGLLGNLRKPGSLKPILARLDDPHWSVQESAENALHNYGAEAVPFLIRALHSMSPSVRLAARLLGEVATATRCPGSTGWRGKRRTADVRRRRPKSRKIREGIVNKINVCLRDSESLWVERPSHSLLPEEGIVNKINVCLKDSGSLWVERPCSLPLPEGEAL